MELIIKFRKETKNKNKTQLIKILFQLAKPHKEHEIQVLYVFISNTVSKCYNKYFELQKIKFF